MNQRIYKKNKMTTSRRSFFQRSMAFIAALTASGSVFGNNKTFGLAQESYSALTTDPFIGEIALVPFTFAPRGWARCAGQLLPINQNQALFSLLGTTFGGNGTTNFALPDLQGRAACGVGTEVALGQKSGTERFTMTSANMPSITTSTNLIQLRGTGTQGAGVTDGGATGINNNTILANTNASVQVVNKMPPYVTMVYIIALTGIFPSPN